MSYLTIPYQDHTSPSLPYHTIPGQYHGLLKFSYSTKPNITKAYHTIPHIAAPHETSINLQDFFTYEEETEETEEEQEDITAVEQSTASVEPCPNTGVRLEVKILIEKGR